MVDIAREALALSGFELNYQTLNWARAKQITQTGELDGIVGMSSSINSQRLYYFPKTPLAQSQICFYRRADDNWQYQSIESLAKVKFGWINNYLFASAPLDSWVEEHIDTRQLVNITGKNAHRRLLRLLEIKRIDTFAEDRNVVAYAIKQQGLENEIKIAGCLPQVDKVYLAFSLQAEQKEVWAKALDRGIIQLQQMGKLQPILSRYGLTTEAWLASIR
ncbi:hypothetical protein AAOGI_30890 [Agarivorans albus]